MMCFSFTKLTLLTAALCTVERVALLVIHSKTILDLRKHVTFEYLILSQSFGGTNRFLQKLAKRNYIARGSFPLMFFFFILLKIKLLYMSGRFDNT